ncbi:hypothetical protein [Dysosmobacter sp.]|uniref:hypothetical protein n=1 Tax=Dysosmobacter sp. TaxID=2591382 RepID=UPI003AB6EE07
MGHFSQRAITSGDSQSNRRADGCDMLSVDPLQLHLDHLYAVHNELTSICPKDPLDPLYDCYVYEDHIAEQYEMPMTIQGVLRAIEAVKETLEDRKLRETERNRFVASILDSGATPDGQIAMVSVFLPLIEAVRQRQVLNRNDPVLTPIFAIK